MRGPSVGAVRLRAWLTASGHNNRWLAEQLGVAESNVGRWLAGMWAPNKEARAAIEKLCLVPVGAWDIAAAEAA